MLDIPAEWKVTLRVPEIHVHTCTCNIKVPWHTPHTRQAKAQIPISFTCWSDCNTHVFAHPCPQCFAKCCVNWSLQKTVMSWLEIRAYANIELQVAQVTEGCSGFPQWILPFPSVTLPKDFLCVRKCFPCWIGASNKPINITWLTLNSCWSVRWIKAFLLRICLSCCSLIRN